MIVLLFKPTRAAAPDERQIDFHTKFGPMADSLGGNAAVAVIVPGYEARNAVDKAGCCVEHDWTAGLDDWRGKMAQAATPFQYVARC